MTILELEQVTREYIQDIYNKEYIGKMLIEKLNPVGYSIKLGLNVQYQPIVIHAELEDEKFLKFLKEDLKSRRFNLAFFGELNLRYPNYCNSRNINCCEEGRINRQN